MIKKLGAALTAGVGGIVAAVILSSTANDPPGSIVVQGATVFPKLYSCAIVGDGLSPMTSFRPAIADDLDGKPHEWKYDPDTGQVVVWAGASDHAILKEKHELLGLPKVVP